MTDYKIHETVPQEVIDDGGGVLCISERALALGAQQLRAPCDGIDADDRKRLNCLASLFEAIDTYLRGHPEGEFRVRYVPIARAPHYIEEARRLLEASQQGTPS